MHYYGNVAPDLYNAVLNRCVEPNRMCLNEMMNIDKQGGQGLPGTINLAKLDADTRAKLGLENLRERIYVSATCSVNDPAFASLDTMNASL